MMQLLSLISANSIDCPALINFASSLGLSTSDPFLFQAISTGDCCKSYDLQETDGIACENGRVVYIWFALKSADGFINATALNLLTQLDHLEIECNALTGVAPATYSDSITFMNFGSNYLTGPFLSFPRNIQYLHLDNDYFSGALPDMPDTLQDLRIDANNAFTGVVHMKTPVELIASGQLISRVYFEDISQLSLAACHDCYGFCDISDTLVYQTQVAYLSTVCTMSNIIPNTECGVVQNIATDLGMTTVNFACCVS